MYPDDISHMDAQGRDEQQARPSSRLHERPVELHRPYFRLNLSRGELGVRPFHDEIHQSLRLDGLAGRISEGLTHELDRPLGDSTCGLPTLDDLAQGEGRDHRDGVADEIVLQLASGEDYGVD